MSSSLVPRFIRKHREAEGLLACYVAQPGGMVNLLSSVLGTRAGTADPMRSGENNALDAYFDGAGDSYDFGTTALLPNLTSPNTIVVECQLDAFIDSFPQVAGFAVSGGTQYRLLYSNNSTYNDISFGDQTGNLRAVLIPSGISLTAQRHWIVLSFDGVSKTADSSYQCWVNGQLCAFTTSAAPGALTNENRIGGASSTSGDWNGVIRQVRLYNRQWTEADAIEFWRNRGNALFMPVKRQSRFAASVAGGTTHATTGVLTGPGSTIAGTAAHIAKHATSGTLTGQGAVVAGTAAHIAVHATSGALAGQGAVVAGVAERTGAATEHATSGALIGQGATLDGTAAHIAVHVTSGVLIGQGSTITGAASGPIVETTQGPTVGNLWKSKKKSQRSFAIRTSPYARTLRRNCATPSRYLDRLLWNQPRIWTTRNSSSLTCLDC